MNTTTYVLIGVLGLGLGAVLGTFLTALFTVGKTDRITRELKRTVERLRMQLCACSVLANANTREALGVHRIARNHELWCPAISDVQNTTQREIEWREETQRLKATISQLEHNLTNLQALLTDEEKEELLKL